MITVESKSLSEQSKELLSYLRKTEKPLLTITLDHCDIQLSELDKPLGATRDEHGEEHAFLKRDLVEYYLRVAPYLLPLLKDRPLTVKLFDGGLSQAGVLKRHFAHAPAFVKHVEMYSEYSGDNEPFLLCQNLATLLWLINHNAIEFYPWHSTIDPEKTGLPTIFINSIGTLEMSVANHPDLLSLSINSLKERALETVHPTEWTHIQKAAYITRTYLERRNLTPYLKYNGEGGVDIILPIQRTYTYERVRAIALQISQQITSLYPDQFAAGWELNQRSGKVAIDSGQNGRNKAAIVGYSLKATKAGLTVALPLDWKTLMVAALQNFMVHHFIEHFTETGMQMHSLSSDTIPDATPDHNPELQRSRQHQVGSYQSIPHTWRYLFKKPQPLPEQLPY